MMTDVHDTGQAREERTGWWRRLTDCGGMMTEADRHNYNRFTLWLALWAGSFILATLALEAEWVPAGAARWAVAVAPGLLGLVPLLLYIRFLRRADELTRKIQVEGLAFGFGVGVMFSMAYRLIERAGAPALDINDPVLVMLLAWVVGQIVAVRRYR